MTHFTQKKRMFRPFTVFLLLFILSLSACLSPQKNTGDQTSTTEYRITKNVVIPLFNNTTLEPLLEKELTRIFKETFFVQGWQIQNKHTGSEKILTGKITAFSVTPTALSLIGGARAYQIKILMDILLQGDKEGVILKTKLEGISDYTARPNAAADRAAKNRAIREAAREMAERTTAFLEMPLRPTP
ncbi:MAG: LPS assembly lipoprotein LptE [Nitrospirota bacterium]|nr:LPS assembly lipoprotein LptE [Nitrospirota bacterium]